MKNEVRRAIIEQWLNNGISNSPALLHGTSVEALFRLFREGILHSGVSQPRARTFFYDPTEDRLYFDTKNEPTDYAQFHAVVDYVLSKLRVATPDLYFALHSSFGRDLDELEKEESIQEVLDECRLIGITISREKLKDSVGRNTQENVEQYVREDNNLPSDLSRFV